MAIPPPPRVPQPQADRADLLSSLGIERKPPKQIERATIFDALPAVPPAPVIATPDPDFVKPESAGGGIFEIPVLGPIIDVLDTPRAAVVSTVKEVGDLFAGDGFSPTDWFTQTRDNMMMGEVLRDWGVDLGGWNLVLGLGLDIAMDPLTYLLGGAIATRYASLDDATNAVLNAARAAEKAKDGAKAARLREAAGTMKKKNSIYAAGTEALEEIGLDVGLRFTVPMTGRMGRGIVERPLRAMFPKLGQKLDARRVGQLPQVKIKDGSRFWRWSDEALEGGPRYRRVVDYSTAAGREAIENQVKLIREGKKLARVTRGPRTGELAESAKLAQQALRMPVESTIKIPRTAGFVRVTAGLAGSTIGGLTATKMGRYLATQMSSTAPINLNTKAAARKGDWEMMNVFLNMRRAGNQGKVSADLWGNISYDNIRGLKRDADRYGIDFDELLMVAGREPKKIRVDAGGYGQMEITNPVFSNMRFGDEVAGVRLSERYVTDPIWSDMHRRVQEFWADLAHRGNEALPYSTPIEEIKDEFYVMRALKDSVAKKLGVVFAGFGISALIGAISCIILYYGLQNNPSATERDFSGMIWFYLCAAVGLIVGGVCFKIVLWGGRSRSISQK